MKTKKGRKQRKQRAEPDCLGEEEEEEGEAGKVVGPCGRTRASRLSWTGKVEQGRSCWPGAFSSVLVYLRYPRRGLNVYHNPVATTATRLKLFLHNILSNQPAISAVGIPWDPDRRAPLYASHGWPRGSNETQAQDCAACLPACDLRSRWHCAMTPGPKLCR